MARIGIVGNGFSGIVTAHALVKQASVPFDIYIFDSSTYSGSGIAYSTDCPLHLLNVPVENMSALQDVPDHLCQWLENSEQWRDLDPSFSSLKIHKKLFLPRMIYHAYLQYIAGQTRAIATAKGIALHATLGSAVDIEVTREGKIDLHTNSGQHVSLDAVVLATGISWTHPIENPDGLNSDAGYLMAPWPVLTSMQKAKKWLENTTSHTNTAIIGSGLTMLDALGSLHACGYPGKIEIISHRVHIPQPHDVTLTPLKPFSNFDSFPTTALGIMQKLRDLSKNQQFDWRCIVDALRPVTCSLWDALPINEKRRILRHLLPFWNIYRHRSPSEALVLFKDYLARKRLALLEAKAVSLGQRDHKIELILHDAHSKIFSNNYFDKVINCTGPSFSIGSIANPLIQNMLRKGIAHKDALGLGMQAKGNRLTSEIASGKIYAIGSLLFGTHFETLAVPELRKQCQQVAKLLTTEAFLTK